MFSFIKRNKETSKKPNSSTDLPELSEQIPLSEAESEADANLNIDASAQNESPEETKKELFGRLKQRLSKTLSSITDGTAKGGIIFAIAK